MISAADDIILNISMIGKQREQALPSTMVQTKNASPVPDSSLPSTKLASRMPNASEIVK